MTLRDLYGRALQAQHISGGTGALNLDTSGLAKGTYFVCLEREGHILQTAKLIIK